jgi:oligoribonuclease
MSDEFLLWMDLETTGTDEHKDEILEVACVLTDSNLAELSSYETTIWPDGWDHDDGLPETIDSYVFQMHTKNGLWEDCAQQGITLAQAQHDIAIRLRLTGRPQYVLAGSGVSHFDRRFLDAQMPLVTEWLKYYSIDVGVLRRTLRLIGCGDLVPDGPENKAHRAMADIRSHLDELRHYKRELGELMAGWSDEHVP